jgi:hemolysin III
MVNWLTHGFGLALSLVGLGALLALSAPQGLWPMTVCLIYGLSLVTLFGVSTFYHASPLGPMKKKARLLDHCAIPILIAGSYTPFMALALGGWKGWGVLLAVWCLALFSIRHKFTSSDPYGAASVVLCLLMGWLIMLVWHPLTATMGPAALAWLVAGGLAYTAGVPVYAWRGLPYGHGIWHGFVLAGAGCHYIAVLKVVLLGQNGAA